jgi:hypothetical protein
MRTFQLKDGANTFTLGDDGSVTLGGADAGKWSTSNDNKIVITKDAKVTSIPVDWIWTSDNHLTVQQGSAAVFDVNGSGTSQPAFALTDKAVLKVKPESQSAFEFLVRPKWELSPQHDLVMTVNGKKSTIDGVISDANSAFKFHFVDKLEIIEKYTLNFKGEWRDDPDEDDPSRLIYQYNVEGDPAAPAAATAVFKLPNKLAVDNNFNVLAYSYDKAGRTRSIQLVGQFNISQFEMSYAIERKSAADGVTTTLRFEIDIKGSTQDGKLTFDLKKKSGAAPSTTLTIGGQYTAKFKSGILTVAFGFKQQTIGTSPAKRELTFSGALVQTSGTTFVWKFEMGNGKTEISVGASQLTLGPVAIDTKVKVTMQNGSTQAVRAMLGVSF